MGETRAVGVAVEGAGVLVAEAGESAGCTGAAGVQAPRIKPNSTRMRKALEVIIRRVWALPKRWSNYSVHPLEQDDKHRSERRFKEGMI